MIYTVNITSQGQISIPVKLRRKYQMDKAGQVLVRDADTHLSIEPIPDILSLRGVFASKVKKRISWETERKLLGEAWATGKI